jgi:hypothetical protein
MNLNKNIFRLQRKLLRKHYGPVGAFSLFILYRRVITPSDLEKWDSFVVGIDEFYYKYRALIFLCVFILPSLAFLAYYTFQFLTKIPEINFKDLFNKNGVYFERKSTVPYSGRVTGNRNGILSDGLEIGIWKSYHKNGQIWYRENYINGKRVDFTMYTKTGRVIKHWKY